jgi:hypothetical protein
LRLPLDLDNFEPGFYSYLSPQPYGAGMNLFEQLLNFLVTGAIFLTVVTAYLVANKIWSRKHERVVAESVSVSAQLISAMTMLPFLIKYIAIDGDHMSFWNMAIRLVLALLYLAIGVGFWVKVSGRDSFWTKIKRALKLEKAESMDLINALIRPNGAKIMLDVLQRLAMIDKNLDQREKEFIQDFADRWNIKIDFSVQFEQSSERATEGMYVDIHRRLSDYLSISPDKKQASQFLDIINLLINADKDVSDEEQLITAEIVSMI